MWPQPHIVLDQNQLQNAQMIAKAVHDCQCHGLFILLPQAAFFEMAKSSKPLVSIQKSLAHLATHLASVCVAKRIMPIIREEARTGVACDDIVDWNATESAHLLIDAVANDHKPSLDHVHGNICKLLPISMTVWGDDEHFKVMLLELTKALSDSLSPVQLSAIRRLQLPAFAAFLASKNWTEGFVNAMSRFHSATPDAARKLVVSPSMSSSFYAALITLGLWWEANGGLGNVTAKKCTNDFLDLEYASMGAYSCGFRTSDKRAHFVFQAISLYFDLVEHGLSNVQGAEYSDAQ